MQAVKELLGNTCRDCSEDQPGRTVTCSVGPCSCMMESRIATVLSWGSTPEGREREACGRLRET